MPAELNRMRVKYVCVGARLIIIIIIIIIIIHIRTINIIISRINLIRQTNGQQTTNNLPTNGKQTTKTLPTHDQQTANTRPTNDQQTANKRPTLFKASPRQVQGTARALVLAASRRLNRGSLVGARVGFWTDYKTKIGY